MDEESVDHIKDCSVNFERDLRDCSLEFIAQNGGGAGARRTGVYCSLKIVSNTFPFSPTMHTKVCALSDFFFSI